MSYWVSKAEVAQLTGWSARSIERRHGAEIVSRPMTRKSANGRPQREYAVHSLPGDAQKRFFERQLQLAAESSCGTALQHPGKQPGTVARSEKLQRGIFDATPDLADIHRAILPPALEKQARERYEAIAPLLQFMKNRSSAAKPLSSGAEQLRSLGAFTDWIAAQRGVHARTLWRWYSRFRKHGYASLADMTRSDKGKSRYFIDNPVLGSFIEKKYLSERLSFRMCHEALLRECEKRGLGAPDYKTVRVYLKALPKALQIISREGERQYHDRCEMFLVKKYSDHLANDIWVSDHMIHDVWVRNDIFPDHPADAPIRPWLTAIIDYRTRKVVGFVHCATPSSDTISAALRVAISQFGPPKTFYIDNGKDYKALGRENTLSPAASGVLVRLGVESQYCQPRHPQSKHIERWFRTLHERFDVLWRPFYSGTSPKDRPEECDQELAEHKKLMKSGLVANSNLPLASEFIQCAAQWIAEYNAKHKHTGRGMDGKAPDELFDAEYPVGQRRSCNIHDLDILLRRREVRLVQEGGCIELNGHRYEPADAASAAEMILQIGRKVLVLCDPANMGEASILDLDQKPLAIMHAMKLMDHGPVSRDEIRASLRQRRMVKRVWKDYVSNLIAGSYARGESSDLDQLRERAGVVSASGGQRVQRTRALPTVAMPAAAAAPVGYDEVAERFLSED